MIYRNIDEAILHIKLMSVEFGEPLYYRGQHHDWNISSSAHRLAVTGNMDAWNRELLKTQNFIDWMKAQRKKTELFDSIDDTVGNLCYWAIAQHYGYRTDL